jgi:hypothetical protein
VPPSILPVQLVLTQIGMLFVRARATSAYGAVPER